MGVNGGKNRVRKVPQAVKFYFSYRSPYAWFATVRLDEMLAAIPVEVLYRPVWEPEPALQARLAAHGILWDLPQPTRVKRRYIFQDVRRHARAYGLPLVWPIDRDPHWSIPHLGFLYARDRGMGAAYHQRVFERRFLHGDDVTERATIARIAEDLGFGGGDLLAAIDDGRYDGHVIRCFQDADEDDVCGWPFFTYGRQRFWGNDRLEWLADIVRADHGAAWPETEQRHV